MSERTRHHVIAPRGLSREQAARYFGVSPSQFDKLRVEGVVPRPKRVGTRKLWDVHLLDAAFDCLPDEVPEEGNAFDDDPL